jgi:IclR family transcriptional regulator, mhp operon transcriptional activator
MAKAEGIRGLERGLRVFKILQQSAALTLADIHEASDLPKPSLLRILATLEAAGMVHRGLNDRRYRISARLTRIARKADRLDRVAEIAAPVLDRLCRKIIWPSDLAVAAGDHMEIRETSRTLSPFVFNSARIGFRINWLLTALGRAYLAFCPDEERRKIVALLRKSDNPQDKLAHQPERLEAILAETRARGYGLRDQHFFGGFRDGAFDDHLQGLAVPLLGNTEVYGCINILWVRRALSAEEMVRQHLNDLKAAAAEISSRLARAN